MLIFAAVCVMLNHGRSLYILSYRQESTIAKAIASWDFSAHDYSEDELVHAAFLMLQHALKMPELAKWRIPAGKHQFGRNAVVRFLRLGRKN